MTTELNFDELSLTTTPAGAMSSPEPREGVEVGYDKHLPFVGHYRDSWEVLRDDPVSIQQLVTMRRMDGQARALYRLVTYPIRAAAKTATFTPVVGIDGGLEEAEFTEKLFTLPPAAGGMTTPFNLVLAHMLTGVFDGFSAFEMVYQVPKDGPLKGKWVLAKIADRPAETLTFLTDDNGDFAGFRQVISHNGQLMDKPLSKDNTFYYTCQSEERALYGRSLFESAFGHWDKICKLYYIAHLASQRAAVGTRVGTMPPSPSPKEVAAFIKGLSDLGLAQFMAHPEGYKVESLKEGGTFDFLSLINHHKSQMSKSLLAGFFDKEQGGGDSAKLVDFGQQSDAMFQLMIETIMDDIETVINNQVIPRFIDWNFKSGKYPAFRFGPLTQAQKKSMLDMFREFATAGQNLRATPEILFELEKQVSEEFGLEIDYDGIAKRMEEEKAQAAELEVQMQEQALLDEQAALKPGTEPADAPAVPTSAVPAGFEL